MIKAVLDTNVLVSSLLSIHSNPAQVLLLVTSRELQPIYSSDMLVEYWAVLRRPRFAFPGDQVDRLINGIIRHGTTVKVPAPSVVTMTDETDRKFYDAAQCAGAWLITGNTRHYPAEPFVVPPAEFVRMYGEGGLAN
jgi:putative PIN family toxin of toxin-antitoxin system